MAVLVLMIASLFSGSPGRVQADVPVKNDLIKSTDDFRWTKLSALHAGKAISPGAFDPAGEAAAFSRAAGIEFAGMPVEDGMVVAGHVSLDSPEHAYTAMVLYMNDSRMKMPVSGSGMFREKNDTRWVVPHKMPGAAFEPGSLSFDGKIAMFRAGSAIPDMFDLRWENMQAVWFGEQMPPTVFSAHLVIPPANGSEVMPLPEWPFPGEYVFDSDVTVDLTNLTFDSEVTVQDSIYDNEIDAGGTQWHSADISSAVKSVNIDLKWSDGSNPLKLAIYTPDGHVLGPFDDSSDGSMDGRINLNVDSPSGVAAGKWSLKVTDTGVAGKDVYYVKTY